MFNYIKFIIYQVVTFISSIPLLLKVTKNTTSSSIDDSFQFLHKQAEASLKLVDINLSVIGKEKIPNEPVLFVANHSSMLDSFILMSSIDRPFGCLIADEPIWRNLPIVNKWTTLLKCVYINRKNSREALKSITQVSKNILNGHSMAVFPEGDLTWVKDPDALVSEFRSGALKIAYKAKCPIVPLVIKNSKKTYDGYHAIGKIHSTPVEVEFLDPIYDHIKNPHLKSVVLGENIRTKMIYSMKTFDSVKKSCI